LAMIMSKSYRKASLPAQILFAALSATSASAQIAPHITMPDAGQILVPPTAPHTLAPQSPNTKQDLELPSQVPNAPHFHFASVRIVGATVVSPDAIAAILTPLEGHDVSAAQLKSALDEINALYLKAGYPLGRAYIPAQILQGSTLIVRLIEGYVGNVVVQADNDKTKALVEGFAANLVGEKPLTSQTLQRYILLVQDLPGITVGSKFETMDPDTGATTLLITASVKAVAATFYLDNRTELYQLPFSPYVLGKINNLLGWGDQITATALLSPDQKDYAFYNLGFNTAVGADGLTMGVTGSWAQALDTETAQPYNVRSQSSQLAYNARYPLIRSTDETLNADGKIYYTHTAYTDLDIPFAHDNFVATQIGGDYVRAFSPTLGLGGNIHLTQGVAEIGDGPHTGGNTAPNFTKLQGEARLAYQPIDNLTLILKGMGQYGSGPLYVSEQVAFGGLQYGRGFNTAEITGDSGVGASFQPEYTIPFDWESPGLGKSWSATPYVFTDYSKVYNNFANGLPNGELVSAGGGVRLGIGSLMTLTLEADKPINRVPLLQENKDARLYVGLEMGVDQALSLIAETP
jgi:hemolysin activation/secretion protein